MSCIPTYIFKKGKNVMHSNMHSSNKQRANHPAFKFAFSLRKIRFHAFTYAPFIIRNSKFHSSFKKRNSKFPFIQTYIHSKRETQSFHSFKHTFTQKEKLKVFIHSKQEKNSHALIHAFKGIQSSHAFIHIFHTNEHSKSTFR